MNRMTHIQVATMAVALATGCGPQPGTGMVDLAGFTFDEQAGVFFAGDQDSHVEYMWRIYLPDALPNVESFRGYAGYMIRYIGSRDPNTKKCTNLSEARIVVTSKSVLRDDATANDLTPAGKMVEELYTQGREATAGVLTFFTGSVSDSTSVQLLVSDVAQQDVFDVVDYAKLKALSEEPPASDECDRQYVYSAVLTEVVSKNYRSVGRRASAQGFNIKVGGRWHNSQSEFSRHLLVYVEPRRLD